LALVRRCGKKSESWVRLFGKSPPACRAETPIGECFRGRRVRKVDVGLLGKALAASFRPIR
jgi:hypothetical protein